jgi:hypothetical protein
MSDLKDDSDLIDYVEDCKKRDVPVSLHYVRFLKAQREEVLNRRSFISKKKKDDNVVELHDYED